MAELVGGRNLARALESRVAQAGSVLKVGILSGATYPDGTPVALVAAINEFGAPSRGQPPRPFLRSAIKANSAQWVERMGDALAFTDFDIPRALALLGESIRGDIQESINQLTTPPLAPSTIAAKGFDKPLIDTSHMLNSVDYEVEG